MNNNFNLKAQALQVESQHQSNVVSRALENKAQRGEYPGKPPIGYLNNTSTKRIVPDPKFWEVIKQALGYYATGKYTIGWITQFLNSNLTVIKNGDHRPLTRSQVVNILQNRFYAGKFTYRSKVYQGKHKPMISKSSFIKIQELLKGGKM